MKKAPPRWPVRMRGMSTWPGREVARLGMMERGLRSGCVEVSERGKRV